MRAGDRWSTPRSRGEPTEDERRALLESLAERFRKPEIAGIDWDLLRDGKLRAWPIP